MKKFLSFSNPDLVKEWHPTRNGNLTPKDVTHGSGKKVWWLCEKGHEWQATILNRSKGSNCPFCVGRKATSNNSLAKVNQELLKEWHKFKNIVTPYEVKPKSSQMVWWKCSNGHEWKARISSRSNGSGCPYCSGRFVSKNNSLLIINPYIAKQWHPTKNDSLKPSDISSNSNYKVWWICERGHEWQAKVETRNRGHGCPYCSGRIASKDNNLAIADPIASKMWHPDKNGNLKPFDVAPHSNKKVWWKCKEGHVWQASVNHVSRGFGCPYCNKKVR